MNQLLVLKTARIVGSKNYMRPILSDDGYGLLLDVAVTDEAFLEQFNDQPSDEVPRPARGSRLRQQQQLSRCEHNQNGR